MKDLLANNSILTSIRHAVTMRISLCAFVTSDIQMATILSNCLLKTISLRKLVRFWDGTSGKDPSLTIECQYLIISSAKAMRNHVIPQESIQFLLLVASIEETVVMAWEASHLSARARDPLGLADLPGTDSGSLISFTGSKTGEAYWSQSGIILLESRSWLITPSLLFVSLTWLMNMGFNADLSTDQDLIGGTNPELLISETF